jgi:hypothetical protein
VVVLILAAWHFLVLMIGAPTHLPGPHALLLALRLRGDDLLLLVPGDRRRGEHGLDGHPSLSVAAQGNGMTCGSSFTS